MRILCHNYTKSYRFPCTLRVWFCKALLLASELPTFYAHFFGISLISSSAGSMMQIPRDCLAWSSFGFSMIHFCFSLRFDASDMSFQISGHKESGLEVVCFLVSRLPDHENPSGGFSSNIVNLVKPLHVFDNSRSPSTFQ